MTQANRDRWANWLLERRYGGDLEQLEVQLQHLIPIRNKVLGNAGIVEGDTVLDVGCGDGLIAFGALEEVGEQGQVIFSDISKDLLDSSREHARESGLLDQSYFLQATAENLSDLQDSSVDVVSTRSVLIYVDDKQSALKEFFRVLRSGGRISLFEPINSFGQPEPRGLFWGYNVHTLAEQAEKLRHFYERQQSPEDDPMLNFDERDLLNLTEDVGFQDIRLELHAQITSTEPINWNSFINTAWNPNMPTLQEAMSEVLTRDEIERFTIHLRPLVEEAKRHWKMAGAYIWAVKG